MFRDCQTGGENDRLGAGAYHGSRRRLRHSISVVGPETPSTKKRSLVAGPFHQPTRSSHWIRGYSGALPPSPGGAAVTLRANYTCGWRMSSKARSHSRSGLGSPVFASAMILLAI